MKKKVYEETIQGTFVIVSDLLLWKYRDPRLALVYGKILSLSRKKHYCYAARGLIARQLCTDITTIDKKIKILEKEGYLVDKTPSRQNGVHHLYPTSKLDDEIREFINFMADKKETDFTKINELGEEDYDENSIFKDNYELFRDYQREILTIPPIDGKLTMESNESISTVGNSDIGEGKIPHKYITKTESNINNNKEVNSVSTHDSSCPASTEAVQASHELPEQSSGSLHISSKKEESYYKDIISREIDSLFPINDEKSIRRNSVENSRSTKRDAFLQPECDRDLEILEHFGVSKFSNGVQKVYFSTAIENYYNIYEVLRPGLDTYDDLDDFIESNCSTYLRM